MATKKKQSEETKVKALFSKLHALDKPHKGSDLSPRQCLEDCLKDVKAQIEGAEAGHSAGYAAGLANRQRHDRENKHTPRRLENLKSFLGLEPTLSSEQIFEALEEQAELQKKAKQNDAPVPTTNPMLQMNHAMQERFDTMNPAEQQTFSEAYLRTYFEGYQKGFQVIAPKSTAISQKTTAGIVDREEAYSGMPGLALDNSDLEVEFDQDTIDLLAEAGSTTPKKIQEAILLYARVDEKTQDDLLPESFPESNELDSDNGKLDTSANPVRRTPSFTSNRHLSFSAKDLEDLEKARDAFTAQGGKLASPATPPSITNITAKRQKRRDGVGHRAVTKAPEGLPKYEKKPNPITTSSRSAPPRPVKAPHPAIPTAVADSNPLKPGHQNSESLTQDLHSVNQALKPNHPASQSGTEASIKPIAFSEKSKAIFKHAITVDYASKEKKFAHRHLSYKKTREKQMKLIDDVREALNNNTAMSDKDKGVVLEAVMSAMLNHLKKEHRWTQVFGTKSRLEAVLRDDIKIIKKDLGLAHSNPLQAMWLIRTHLKDNADLTKECFKILGEKSPGHRIQKPKG